MVTDYEFWALGMIEVHVACVDAKEPMTMTKTYGIFSSYVSLYVI